MDRASEAGLRRLTAANQRMQRELAARTRAATRRLWARYGGVSDAHVAAWLDQIVPLVAAAETTAARTTTAYTARYVEAASGRPGPPLPAVAVDAASIRGVDRATEYSRPSIEARSALSRSVLWVDAMRLAADRAVALADTDVQLARRAAAQAALRALGVTWYRRIASPGACDLCLKASTQRYKVGDLLPIHPGCHCIVQPGVGPDPGHVIDKALLARLKDRNAPRVSVRDHDELGPVLTNADHRFTGPGSGGRAGTGGDGGRGGNPPAPPAGGDDPERLARELLDAARAVEPAITVTVSDITRAAGGKLVDLDKRLKDLGDLLEKITIRRPRGMSLKRAVERLNDVLRYRVVLDDAVYSASADRIRERLLAADFRFAGKRNSWASEGYKAINATFRAPGGQKFEVQFHTASSAAAADLTHRLYAEQRLLPRGASGPATARYEEISRHIAAAFADVHPPPGSLTLFE